MFSQKLGRFVIQLFYVSALAILFSALWGASMLEAVGREASWQFSKSILLTMATFLAVPLLYTTESNKLSTRGKHWRKIYLTTGSLAGLLTWLVYGFTLELIIRGPVEFQWPQSAVAVFFGAIMIASGGCYALLTYHDVK